MSQRTLTRAVSLILGLYLVLGVSYSVVNPVFESPDEALNYANIRFLIRERRLPVLEPDQPTKAHHPPLYYVLGALLTYRVPNQNFEAITERINPFWIHRVSEPGVDNKSLYLHDPMLEGFPYQDVALGVHMVRWLSLLMSVGTLLCVYMTVRVLFSRRPMAAVLSTALVAFNPMFLFISTSVHDDALANLVAAAILWMTAKTLVRGPRMEHAVALGVLTGLAILTKLTCLLVIPTVGLVLLPHVLKDQNRPRWGSVLRSAGVIALLALLIGGWWFVRNQILYGEPTSMQRQVEAWGGTRPNAPNLAAAARELGFLHDSFWGVFGYGQIPMPAWAYGFARLLGLMALGGWFLRSVRHRNDERAGNLQTTAFPILLSAPLVSLLVVFARMTTMDAADFGRYLFVSLGFLAPLYGVGLLAWVPRNQDGLLTLGIGSALLGLAAFALLGVLRPAYARPEMVSAPQVESRTRPADLRFGESIRLVGHELSRHRTHPGGQINVTLCWETLAPTREDYVYFVHLLGPRETIVGARTTHPGLGRYPTSRWSRGDRFCDLVDVLVDEKTPAPAVYHVQIGWHKPGSNENLKAYGPDGSAIELVLLDRVKVAPPSYPSIRVPRRIDANMGEEIALIGYDADNLQAEPGEELNVTLFWEAQAGPSADYTVFLHLASPDNGPPCAQDDGPPQKGTYPTTFWDVGEVVPDPRTIDVPADIPPGDYALIAGMYLLETGERLPAFDAQGQQFPNDAVPIATIEIES